jgi:hypothetical protein
MKDSTTLRDNSTTTSKHKPQVLCTASPNLSAKPHQTCAKHELELARFPSPEGTPASQGHLQVTSLQNRLGFKKSIEFHFIFSPEVRD